MKKIEDLAPEEVAELIEAHERESAAMQAASSPEASTSSGGLTDVGDFVSGVGEVIGAIAEGAFEALGDILSGIDF